MTLEKFLATMEELVASQPEKNTMFGAGYAEGVKLCVEMCRRNVSTTKATLEAFVGFVAEKHGIKSPSMDDYIQEFLKKEAP